MTADQLLAEALVEDAREGSTFSPDGFYAFFPEEEKDTIDDAWFLYRSHHGWV